MNFFKEIKKVLDEKDYSLISLTNGKKFQDELNRIQRKSIVSDFLILSKTCTWRDCLKCKVLHSAREYGRDGCKIDNCSSIK